MRPWLPTLSCLLLLALTTPARAEDDLLPPEGLVAGGVLIDTDVGHAAPFFHDMDGDGLQDLLVGQMGGGKLKVFKNVGSLTKPVFEGFEWFKVGESEATVPSG